MHLIVLVAVVLGHFSCAFAQYAESGGIHFPGIEIKNPVVEVTAYFPNRTVCDDLCLDPLMDIFIKAIIKYKEEPWVYHWKRAWKGIEGSFGNPVTFPLLVIDCPATRAVWTGGVFAEDNIQYFLDEFLTYSPKSGETLEQYNERNEL